ncbi:hypothetical protein ATKI12_0003 [Kitasatospora sp. Ki12]
MLVELHTLQQDGDAPATDDRTGSSGADRIHAASDEDLFDFIDSGLKNL